MPSLNDWMMIGAAGLAAYFILPQLAKGASEGLVLAVSAPGARDVGEWMLEGLAETPISGK